MREFDSNGLRLAEFQAKLFEKSVQRYACSSKIFLRRFLHSDVLKVLDRNESSKISMDVYEALDDIEREFGESDYGKIKYAPDVMFWMGYMYRYISYTRETDTSFLFKLFKYEQLNNLFFTYHTQDPEWCVRNMLELNHLTEDIFDKNWRLKQAMLKKDGNKTCLSKSDKEVSIAEN